MPTGVYQYVAMALAKTYTAGVEDVLAAGDRRSGDVLQLLRGRLGVGVAGDGVGDRDAGRPAVWDAALVAASPIPIFQVFTNFDALATGLAVGGLLAWARRKPTLAGVLIGLGVAAKLYPLLLLLPLVVLALRTDRAADAARTVVATVGAWFLVNLPVMMLFPADGRSSSGSTAPR